MGALVRIRCHGRIQKFLYLMAVSDHPVTPSIEVDQVWHLHLIYTRQYWNDFAKHMPFEPHHGPTKGGSQESEKFIEWYSRLLRVTRMFLA